MRSFAGNFTPEELPKAVEFAHSHGVKVHVTVNTMPRNHEVVELPAYLERLDDAKVDALILAIGETIDRNSKDAIEAARNAYNALTPGAKEYVTKLAVLEEAEAIYAGIFPLWAIILIAAGGVLVLAGAAVAVILVLKKKKAAKPAETSEEAEALPEVTEE